MEKTMAVLGDNLSDTETLAWSWKECTILRVKDAHDFCLTNKPPTASAASPGPGKEGGAAAGKQRESSQLEPPAVAYEGLERIFAAVGLPSSPAPAGSPRHPRRSGPAVRPMTTASSAPGSPRRSGA